MYDPNNGDQQTSSDMNMRRAQQQMPPPVAPGSAGDRYSQYAMQNRYGDQGPQGADAAPPPAPIPAPVAAASQPVAPSSQAGGLGSMSGSAGGMLANQQQAAAQQSIPSPSPYYAQAQQQAGSAPTQLGGANKATAPPPAQPQQWAAADFSFANKPASPSMIGGANKGETGGMGQQPQMPPPTPPSSMGQQPRPQYSGVGAPPVARHSSQGPMGRMGGQPAPTSQIRPNGNPTTQTRKPTPMAQ